MCLSRSQVISYVTHHKAVKRSCSYPSKILIWYSWCSLFFLIFIFKCFKGWILFCILRLWRQEICLLYIFMAKEEGLIWKRWILVRNIPLAGEGSWNCIGPYGHRNPRKWSLRRSLRVQGGACDLFFHAFFLHKKTNFLHRYSRYIFKVNSPKPKTMYLFLRILMQTLGSGELDVICARKGMLMKDRSC